MKIQTYYFADRERPGTCAVCGQQFTQHEWQERHTDRDGQDVHERCCTKCNGSRNIGHRRPIASVA